MMFSIIGKLSSKSKVNEGEIKECADQAKDTSTDFFCMGASFLIAMTLRGLIMGRVMEKEAEAKQHTTTQVVLLTLCGIVFLMLSGSVRRVQHKAKKNMSELLEHVGTTSSLTSAWCLLDAANWAWLHRFTKDKAVGHVVVAIECSVIFIIAVILVSILIKHVGSDTKRTIKGEFTAIGLLLGLAWEHVFDAALEGAEPLLPKENKSISLAFITFVLVLIVFPAWVVYIVPKHDLGASTKVSGRELTPLHAFCDCGGNEVQEEELSEDEEEDEEKAAE
jgi:NADH:ubiquinone oxidoreductase subunit 3 (subunit A)